MRRLIAILVSVVLLLPGQAGLGSTAAELVSTPGGLHLISSTENSLLIELVSPEYGIETIDLDGSSYDRLTLPGAVHTSQKGFPQLPVYSALLGIPPEAEISLVVRDIESSPVEGHYRLPPVPQPQRMVAELQPSEMVYQPDARIYSSAELYPSQPARLAQIAWMRDQRITRLEVSPFQYLPINGSLVWHPRILLEVNFMPGSSTFPSSSANLPDSPFESIFRGALLNYQQARAWRSLASLPAIPDPPTGPRYKIAIDRDGLYRLTYQTLQQAGLDVDNLDPTLLHLDSQGQQVAIYIHNLDGDEHKLSPGEYLAFYGEKFAGNRLAALYQNEDSQWLDFEPQNITGTTITWAPQFNAAMLEKYTAENVYWLFEGTAPGLRMQPVQGDPGSAPIAQTYRAIAKAEESNYWRTLNFTSEDTWYWDRITNTVAIPATITHTITLSAVATGSFSATVRGEMIAEAYNDSASPDHHTTLYINDPAHLQPPGDDRYWDGRSRYQFEFQLPGSQLTNGENQLDIEVHKTLALSSELIYFDKFEIEYQREFQAVADQIIFSPSQPDLWRYQIGGFNTSSLGVLEVTQPLTPTWVTGAQLNYRVLEFQADSSPGARFFAGRFTDLAPAQVIRYDPPLFTQAADYLVITHADFLAPAQALADYRRSQGLSALVVDVADLYNQFNYGIYHPIAIKNFLAWTFARWTHPPQYAVLVGDGTWNFFGTPIYNDLPIYMPPNLAWVDPAQGEVDSANLLAAVVGDDPIPDLMIGRMPVNSIAEMQAIIDKTIHYESLPRAGWQRNMLFVADNVPDQAGDFIQLSEDLISDYMGNGFIPQRIYLNNYFEDPPDDQYCDPGQLCPPVNQAITETINLTGTLLVNYIGHADVRRWAHERIFINDNLSTFDNMDHLPVVLSMTCLDGYWIHPGGTGVLPTIPLVNQSLMEDAFRAEQNGIVASFSPTGLGVASGHDELQRGFYDALLRQGNWNLGGASVSAKLRLFATGYDFDLLNTFTVFGDPALRIPSPYDLDASPASQAQSGPPAAAVSYSLDITNTGSLTDTYFTDVLTNTWPVSLPAQSDPRCGRDAVHTCRSIHTCRCWRWSAGLGCYLPAFCG